MKHARLRDYLRPFQHYRLLTNSKKLFWRSANMFIVMYHVPVRLLYSFPAKRLKIMICRCACQWSCDNSYHSNCIISCPTCYSVVLAYTYRTKSGSLQIVTQSKDFEKNKDKAETFLNDHQLNATSPCHYNPDDLSQARFTFSPVTDSLLTLSFRSLSTCHIRDGNGLSPPFLE